MDYFIINITVIDSTQFIFFSENPNDDIDIETIDKDVKLLTYRPDVGSKSMESYRHSKLPKDPEMWEDNINKYVCNLLSISLKPS